MNVPAISLDAPPPHSPDLLAVGEIAAVPAMLDIICHATGVGFAAVVRVSEERWLACRVRDEASLGIRAGDVLRADTMPCRDAWQKGEPVIINDVGAGERAGTTSAGRPFGFRSYISFPIVTSDGAVFGTLCAIGVQPARLDRPDIAHLFRQFAALIGTHLDARRQSAGVDHPRGKDGTAAPAQGGPLATLIEHLPVGAGLFGPDGQVLLANSALRNLVRRNQPASVPGEGPGWTGYAGDGAILDPQHHPFPRALQGDIVSGARFLCRSDDGTEQWLRITGLPAPAGAVGDGLRIASAPAALLLVEAEHGSNGTEHALRRSEARLQAAVELVGLAPYGWDPATGALEWDARLKAMWGLPADAHVDQAVWISAIHPEDRPRVEEAVARCCDPAGDGVYKIDYRVIGIEDGVERWVSTHGRTQFEDGRPIRFVGVALDITERKRDEAVSRARAERFRQFAEHSANVLWLANLKSRRLTYLSPAVRHVWGVPPERLSSIEDWLDTIHPDDRDSVERAVERVGSGDVVVLEYRILRPSDGIVRRIRDTFFPIRGEKGGIRHVGGIAADVTGRTGARIYVVDRDAESRQKLLALLHPAGYEVQLFESPAALAEVAESLQPGCVILDIEAADPEGLTVAKALKVGRLALPVLVVGRSHGDVGFGVRAMKAGAVDYLEKPWQPAALLTAVSAALAELRTDNERSQARDDARQRIGALSAREREVLEGLLAGGTNKSIGRALGLSPRTVEIHRAHVMETLGVRTLPEAVLMAAKAGVQPTDAL